jgi:serine/threonine protein kinase/tetratricopeptide (TPR) repeat protein
MKKPRQTVADIFTQALDIPDPVERLDYLDRACASNAALRQEVDSLLAANSAAGEFLQHPADAGAAQKTMLIPALSETTGTRIGRYKLLEQIGEGGFGVVWMAEQEEPVRRRVALKIIKLGMDTKEVVARFEAERQALAMMDHPHIASIFDGGATETGRPYFVMELVKGVPITDYADANRLSTKHRLELFMQVCHAVQHAHQKGVIHRDLKPSNILVTVQDDRPVPKVIDFGVAKATQARLTEKTLFTQFRQWIGTPAYMSPEQAGLGSLDVDTRSDVYSLGVLLYELLTGRTPFDTEKLLEKGYDAVMRTIRDEEPHKPSTRLSSLNREKLSTVASKRGADPAKLNRLVHGDLDWIVMKAVEKDRRRRYETPDAFASDVARHLNSEPVSATPPSTAYLFRKYVHRNRVAVTFAATVVLVLVAGLCTTLVALKRARQEKSRAEAGAAISTAINDFLQSTMLDSLVEHRVTNRVLTSRGELDTLAGNIERRFAGQPQVEAAVRFTLGRTYASLGDYVAAEPQIHRAMEIRRKELGASHPATLEALGALGFLRFNQGKPAEAERLLREVLESQRRTLGEGDPATIQTLVMLDAVQTPRGAPTLAPELLKAINSLRDDDPRTLRALHSVVDTLRSEKRLAEAETLGRELLKKRERVLGSNHTETVHALLCLSYTLHEMDRLDECEQLRREALRRGRGTNPTGTETLTAFNRLIELLSERENYDEARRQLEEELEMEQRVLGAESETAQSTREALARLTKLSESRQKAREQLAAAEARIARDDSDGAAWLRRAMAHAGLNQWKPAAGDFQEAMARTNFSDTQTSSDFASACLDLAGKAWDTGQPLVAGQGELAVQASREALRLLRQLEAERPEDGIFSGDAARASWNLANALVSAGRREEARQVFTETLEAFARVVAQQPEATGPRQDLGDTHLRMGNLLEEMEELAEAERHFEIAAAIFRTLKAESPGNAWFWHEEGYATWQRGGVWSGLGDQEAAEALFRQAAALHEQAIANFPARLDFAPRLRAIRRDLASLLVSGGRNADAAQIEQIPQEDRQAARRRIVEDATVRGDYSQALRRLADEIEAEQVQLGPTNEQTLQTVRQLADLAGCVADWHVSVRHMRILMELPGCDLVVLRGCAVAALLDGDERIYREVCARILSEYRTATDAHQADMAAKTCLLIPDAVADLKPVFRLAEAAAASQPDFAWYRLVKGMAEYRAGNASKVLPWLDEPASNDDPRIASLAGLISAMAQHRLGKEEQARVALSAASRQLDALLSNGNLGEQAGPQWWFDAAAAILIRAEAERLILGREVSPRPTTDSLAAARRMRWSARQKLGSDYPAALVVPAGWKASWSPDSQRMAFGKSGGGIAVLDFASGRVADLVQTGKDPAWSPDGRFIAYVTDGSEEYYSEEVWVVSTNGGQSMKLGKGGFPSWSADSARVLFPSRDRNEILAVRVGESSARPTVFFPEFSSWYPAISPDESRIAFCAREQLIIVDRKTAQTVATLPMPGARGALPAWSPDGKQVAFGSIAGSRSGLWVYDVERRGAFQVARNGGCTMPAWSPDGESLAFDLRGKPNEIWVVKTKSLPSEPELAKQLPAESPQPAVEREKQGGAQGSYIGPQSRDLTTSSRGGGRRAVRQGTERE